MPSYQLPVNTPLKSKLVWKRSWWGEGKRFVWSIQLFIDSFFFLFFFSTMALCNVLQFFVNTGDKRLSSIIVKGERIFQQDEGTCALTLISWLPCERLLQREGSTLRSNCRAKIFAKFYFQSKLFSYFNIMPIFLSLVILSSRDLKNPYSPWIKNKEYKSQF